MTATSPNVARLHELLDAAVKLELSTIPPYLCALYTILPDTNEEAVLTIRSVVVEEMLHMILAANVMNAVGAQPKVTGRDNAPHYPHELPDGVVLDLLPYSPAAIEAFLKVENPGHQPDPAHAAAADGRRETVHQSCLMTMSRTPTTIGEFYAEIADVLDQCVAEVGEKELFCGDPARQVNRDYYYAGGGAPIEVTDLDSAKRALAEIVEQGEGEMRTAYDTDGDLAHYYRFQQLKFDRAYLPDDSLEEPTGPPVGVDYAAAYPMLPNPHSSDYADPDLQAAVARANHQWSRLLEQIEAAVNGAPEMLIPAVHTMFRLRDAMLVLLANPMPGHDGYHAGPTFEWQDA